MQGMPPEFAEYMRQYQEQCARAEAGFTKSEDVGERMAAEVGEEEEDEFEDEMEEDEDEFEDEEEEPEPTVTVGGVEKALSEVTDADQAAMTNEEYQIYTGKMEQYS
jgi:hypothetical protein